MSMEFQFLPTKTFKISICFVLSSIKLAKSMKIKKYIYMNWLKIQIKPYVIAVEFVLSTFNLITHL